MRGDNLKAVFARVRERAGVLSDPAADNAGRRTPPTPHDCRATGASLLQATGLQAPTAQGWLGHANAQITLDLYTEIRQFGEEDQHTWSRTSPRVIRLPSISVGSYAGLDEVR